MKVLVVTTEPCPLPGLPTTGAGLRAWALAQGLESAGIQAEVAMAADALRAADPEARSRAADYVFERPDLAEHIHRRRADILVMQHWGLVRHLGETNLPLAIDLAGPHILERRFWGSPSPQADIEEKLAALARADFLTCSGHRQRTWFLAFAAMAGYDPTDPDLLPTIPYSVAPDLPETPQRRNPERILYSGVFLPWQDPSAGIEAALAAMGRLGRGRLLFIGGAHPAGDVSGGRFDALLERLRGHDRVEVLGMMPWQDFVDQLELCALALDLAARNPERELAFTSRTVVYMAAGLPVLYNDYSELSQWIAEAEAGWTVSPEAPHEIERIVEQAIGNPDDTARRGANARRMVGERLTWDRTIAPLAAWCRNPVVRSGKKTPPAPSRLQAALEELRGRRLVRLSEWLRRVGLR